jgi:hypothetical protein
MAIPCTLADDRELFAKISERYGEKRWMLIPNTLHVERIFVSADLAQELRQHPRCQVAPSPTPLTFVQGRLSLFL